MLQRNIRISANGIDFDLDLKANMVLVDGASGIGKSMLFRALRDYSLINVNKYLCINKDTLTDSNIIKSMILGADNKLIIIDNAEIVLDNELRFKISTDTNNQYLIFTHSTKGFAPMPMSFSTLEIKGSKGYLVYDLE